MVEPHNEILHNSKRKKYCYTRHSYRWIIHVKQIRYKTGYDACHSYEDPEKEMATHSSILAWRIPGMEEPGGLPSMGSHGVGHDWSDLAAAAAAYEDQNPPKWIYVIEFRLVVLCAEADYNMVWGDSLSSSIPVMMTQACSLLKCASSCTFKTCTLTWKDA